MDYEQLAYKRAVRGSYRLILNRFVSVAILPKWDFPTTGREEVYGDDPRFSAANQARRSLALCRYVVVHPSPKNAPDSGIGQVTTTFYLSNGSLLGVSDTLTTFLPVAPAVLDNYLAEMRHLIGSDGCAFYELRDVSNVNVISFVVNAILSGVAGEESRHFLLIDD